MHPRRLFSNPDVPLHILMLYLGKLSSTQTFLDRGTMASADGKIPVTVINLTDAIEQVFDTPSEFSYPTYAQRSPPVRDVWLWSQLTPPPVAVFNQLQGPAPFDDTAAAAADVKPKAAASLGDGFAGGAAASAPGAVAAGIEVEAPVISFDQGPPFCVRWLVDVVKLFEGKDKKGKCKVSPSFQLPVAGKQAEFKILLVPKSQLGTGRKIGGFDTSQGQCAVQLRRFSALRTEALSFYFVVGGERRGPVHADFCDGQCACLPKETQLWKLGDFADVHGQVSVCVELVPGVAEGELFPLPDGAAPAGA